jgi:hypothetical protein
MAVRTSTHSSALHFEFLMSFKLEKANGAQVPSYISASDLSARGIPGCQAGLKVGRPKIRSSPKPRNGSLAVFHLLDFGRT